MMMADHEQSGGNKDEGNVQKYMYKPVCPGQFVFLLARV